MDVRLVLLVTCDDVSAEYAYTVSFPAVYPLALSRVSTVPLPLTTKPYDPSPMFSLAVLLMFCPVP